MSSVKAKRGYKGPYVEQLQRQLNRASLGITLTPDGDFGSQTEGAVYAFQSQESLMVDGVVGAFTDAVLFGKVHQKLRRQPSEVYQGATSNCWAAATESWLTTQSGRRNYTQEQIISGMISEGGAKSNGALRIPSGQTLWELYYGLRPVSVSADEFYAETAYTRMSWHGPLMIGYKPSGSDVGHVEVMWGTTIHKGKPAVITMDPLKQSNAMKVIMIPELHGMSGRVTTWMPKVPLLI